MKSITNKIVYAVFMLAIFTQCESLQVEPFNPDETVALELVIPANKSINQSLESELVWKQINGAKTYRLQISESASFDSTQTDTTITQTSFKTPILSPGTTYYWKVNPIKLQQSLPWSDVWSFTTLTSDDNPGSGSSVSLISPADNASDISINPTFEWAEASATNEYEFQLSEDSSFSQLADESMLSESTYQINNLSNQNEYFWRVRIRGEENEWSNVNNFTTVSNQVSPPPAITSFVQVHNSNFIRDGEVMRFAGTNAYYLPNYEKLNPDVVNRALNLFQDTGINVIRMWGFYDGYDCGYSKTDANENVIQTSPGVYSESALVDLDNVIAKGKERGVGFIIPFINFWDELGGVCQYNTWAGASDPSTNMEFFLSNSDTQKWYKDYIKMLLNRVNTVTGIAYKDEPAIVAWQIMNEGRNSGKDPVILRDWYQSIAQYIKSIDPNHLISTGEEGFDEGTPSEYSASEYSNTYTLRAQEGTSYVMNTAIPEIDFGNAHWYPSEYGFGSTVNENLLQAQRAWINDHKKIAENSGKPFMLGEYGFPGWADERVSTMYSALYEHSESVQLDGSQLWQLTADGTKCWEFGGNICYPAGREDNTLYNDFKNHVIKMKSLK